ncbi:MAG: SAM-dependent methyltransferase [Alteromonadaceae bacterium]|nr:MAG: SAM-dependent methyltransferase [Alteromonadaceae bacterium]
MSSADQNGLLQNIVQGVKSRFSTPELGLSYPAISRWFESPLGRALLAAERIALEDQLSYLFGYHLMQLSSVSQAEFASSSRINHCFRMAPTMPDDPGEISGQQAYSDFDELPLADDTVDVCILHHVLEFSQRPHQVLREAARVTIPRGYIIIVAFNPVSIAGLLQPLGALFEASAVSRRRHLRVGRMKDWLQLLDFNCLDTQYLFHNLPLNGTSYLANSSIIRSGESMRQMPGGLAYCMLARKDKAGLTPIKLKWAERRLLVPIQLSKQPVARPVGKEGLILPFRPPVNK